MPDELEGRRVLLLQGPVGPFFRRLADELRARGAKVTKVNFNAADTFFYWEPSVIHFREEVSEWPNALRQMFATHDIDLLVLFGDCRTHHRQALQLAVERGIEAYVFEEGYIRPDHITLERGGVNARSSLPKSLPPYLELGARHPEHTEPLSGTFFALAVYSIVYALVLALGKPFYPKYRHHKQLYVFEQTYFWIRGAFRKLWYAVTERHLLEELTEEDAPPYFLVPLQVHYDPQVKESRLGSMQAFISEVMESFSRHSTVDAVLVFKHHPLDRAYRNYHSYVDAEAERLGLTGRTYYLHDQHLPTLLRHAKGTVVLNSTVGASSLWHGTPVKVLDHAVYDLEGLTYQGPLDEFWADPGSVDRAEFKQFRSGLVALCQVNGSFYQGAVEKRVFGRASLR